MKKLLVLAGLAAFALLAFSPTASRADITWDFSYAGLGVSASGTLTTSDVAVPLTGIGYGGDVTSLTGYQITGITGTRNGDPITGLANNPSFPGYVAVGGWAGDNAVIPGGALDYYGLLYTVGSDYYNVYSVNSPSGGGYLENSTLLSTLTIAPVPEPATVISGALLLLPFGASTLRILRKRQVA